MMFVLSVCPSVADDREFWRKKTIDRDAVWVSGAGPWNRVFDRRAHWHHLANTVERLCAAAVSGSATGIGDVACFQIALGNFVRIRKRNVA